MNVTHVQLPADFLDKIGDKLEWLITAQADHEVEYNEIEREHGHYVPEWPINLNDRLHAQHFKDGVYRMIEELGEATNCLKNRPHTRTEYVTDEVHFLEEFGDALHYFLRLVVMLGLSGDDLVKIYYQKSEVNKFRRESRY